jgi:Protein of unknown function (DUF3025)
MPAGAAYWRAIDWRATWLAPYAELARPVLERLEQGASVAQAMGEGAPRFVAHAELPSGEAYESFVWRTGNVPTRDNLHDLFNALVWRRFPALKRRLSQLHAAQIEIEGIGTERGPLRDALTLFDENAALLQAPRLLFDALCAHDWHALFVTQRAAWHDAQLTLFGHALLEKLTRPRKAITAHVCLVAADDPATLTPEWLTSKPFLPLPVLGVPGWWSGNEDAAFYDDAAVFRPARR